MEYKFSLNDYNLDIEQIKKVYGFNDINIKKIEKEFNCEVFANGINILVKTSTNNYSLIKKCFETIVDKVINDEELGEKDVTLIINNIINKKEFNENIKFVTTYNGKIIRPKNYSQGMYFNKLENNTIIFATGSAGTGKTYLAVAYGVNMLKLKKIDKIILTRPIVEAGENLGFLPGELKEKVDPYLTPIYDALNDILGKELVEKYMLKGVIEIAPLAYMRGRTLNDCFVILDEAQNTTSTQMKMFLTRLGYNSKMVITGDESQIDLKPLVKSGIVVACDILKNIDDIAFMHFNVDDVVRNPLVSKIILAYDKLNDEKR